MPEDALIAIANAMYAAYCRKLGAHPQDVANTSVQGDRISLQGTSGGALIVYRWSFDQGGNLRITVFSGTSLG